jgi:hypothetical protein
MELKRCIGHWIPATEHQIRPPFAAEFRSKLNAGFSAAKVFDRLGDFGSVDSSYRYRSAPFVDNLNDDRSASGDQHRLSANHSCVVVNWHRR